MPLQGILNTARSLAFYTRLQEVTANNLANVESDAFKADHLTARQLAGTQHPVPVAWRDLQQGAFRETARPLDLALDGPGFFVVGTEAGERLTRGGSLRLDGAGRLTDAHGAPVLGEQGPIVVTGAEVLVQSDGTLMVDGAVAGKLRLATVEDPGQLLKEGLGRYRSPGPLLPVADGVARVRQGAVEGPNVDALTAMVDLVTIQRAYAANIDALRAMDGVLGVVTGEVGKVP
jgi:flagellar basal body rod protein FlgG